MDFQEKQKQKPLNYAQKPKNYTQNPAKEPEKGGQQHKSMVSKIRCYKIHRMRFLLEESIRQESSPAMNQGND